MISGFEWLPVRLVPPNELLASHRLNESRERLVKGCGMEIPGGGGLPKRVRRLTGQQAADRSPGQLFRPGFNRPQRAKVGFATVADGPVPKPGLT
jgi:hypothetical protein